MKTRSEILSERDPECMKTALKNESIGTNLINLAINNFFDIKSFFGPAKFLERKFGLKKTNQKFLEVENFFVYKGKQYACIGISKDEKYIVFCGGLKLNYYFEFFKFWAKEDIKHKAEIKKIKEVFPEPDISIFNVKNGISALIEVKVQQGSGTAYERMAKYIVNSPLAREIVNKLGINFAPFYSIMFNLDKEFTNSKKATLYQTTCDIEYCKKNNIPIYKEEGSSLSQEAIEETKNNLLLLVPSDLKNLEEEKNKNTLLAEKIFPFFKRITNNIDKG